MKKILIAALLLVILSGCKTKKPAAGSSASETRKELEGQGTNFSDQSTWLLGYFNPAQLSRPPHSEWYLKGFDQYQPNVEAMTRLQTIIKDDLTITIVMGTWCPDSRREVPRFMRVLDLWNFPQDNVTFIGVDNTKLAPVGGYDALNIERVPTFIILKNKVEAGRIIENPETSLEQDIVNILTRNEK
jgi:thiol-disulfide isomerase/thioredoxin